MTFDDEDAVGGVERLERVGFALPEIEAALKRDEELARYYVGTANGVLLTNSIDGLRRLASQRRRRPSRATIRAGNRFYAPRR
jgi:hypothetical protein